MTQDEMYMRIAKEHEWAMELAASRGQAKKPDTFRYQVVIELDNGEYRYLGEHLLNADDPWSALTLFTKTHPENEKIIGHRAYAEYMPFYKEIVDADTFFEIAGENW